MSTVKVTFEDGIAWVALNRPDKRNAMSVAMANEMNEVLDVLEIDDRCSVLVLTGAGDAFSAGMDVKDFFRHRQPARYRAAPRLPRNPQLARDWT